MHILLHIIVLTIVLHMYFTKTTPALEVLYISEDVKIWILIWEKKVHICLYSEQKEKKKTIIFSGQSLRVTATALGIPFHLWIPKMKSSSLLLWKCSRQNCLQFQCIVCVMHNISLSHAQMQQLAAAPPFVGMRSKSNVWTALVQFFLIHPGNANSPDRNSSWNSEYWYQLDIHHQKQQEGQADSEMVLLYCPGDETELCNFCI